jgi:drug/metabolite transporter (DMT)-like permease
LAVALASICLSAMAQVVLKLGMARALTSVGSGAPWWRQIGSGITQPAVLAGLAIYAGGALMWLYVLARWDVSKAYPLVGAGFVLTLLIGVSFLGEALTWERTLGCLLVCGGLVLIVRS